jgi:hypothetical protein
LAGEREKRQEKKVRIVLLTFTLLLPFPWWAHSFASPPYGGFALIGDEQLTFRLFRGSGNDSFQMPWASLTG